MLRPSLSCLLLALTVTAGCSFERGISPPPRPQKMALKLCVIARSCDRPPLLIVDGRQTSWDEEGDLDPGIIESVDITRGQAAVRQYGKAAEHGVVVITTKRVSRLQF